MMPRIFNEILRYGAHLLVRPNAYAASIAEDIEAELIRKRGSIRALARTPDEAIAKIEAELQKREEEAAA